MHKLISTTLNLNICRGKQFKVDVIDLSKQEFMPAILFSLDHTLHISKWTILSDFQIANQWDCQKHEGSWGNTVLYQLKMKEFLFLSRVLLFKKENRNHQVTWMKMGVTMNCSRMSVIQYIVDATLA